MEAYKKYGFSKGTILTAWRICRCNPLGSTFMQSKINSFFKPSSSVPQDVTSSDGEGDDELLNWEKTEHEILSTYKRQADRAFSRPMPEALFQRQDGHDCSGSVSKMRKYGQLHLEFGQSDFLIHTCSTCGVKYARGDKTDEKNHTFFHKNYTHGIPFKGWRLERKVDVLGSLRGHVILVKSYDPPYQRKKVNEVLKMMEIKVDDSLIFHSLCQVYLAISCQRVVGCLVAEKIIEAIKIKSPLVDEKCEVLNGYHNGAIVCEKESTPAVCGIRAIWVTPSNRRKGVATCLLNSVRNTFLMDRVLGKPELAFSQTTSAGMAFASNYMGTNSFLLYRADS